MQKKWIVPMVAGMLSLSLMGCSNTRVEPLSDAIRSMEPQTERMSTAVTDARANYHHGRTSTGEQMVEGARYYADGEGVVDEDGREMTQKGCKNCPSAHREMDDVERALRDVGRTMDSMRTDI